MVALKYISWTFILLTYPRSIAGGSPNVGAVRRKYRRIEDRRECQHAPGRVRVQNRRQDDKKLQMNDL